MRNSILHAMIAMLALAVWSPTAPAAEQDTQQVAVSPNDGLFTVALLQMVPHGNDIEKNFDKAERFCRRAAMLGADVALMPEMWSIGYTRFDPDEEGSVEAFWDQALARDSEEIQRFAKLARELNMAIGVTYEEKWDPMPRNSITLFDRHGKEVFTYAKIHTSDFKPMETMMTPGDDFYVGELDTVEGSVQVGSMICFDRENPESARILMVKGAEVILTPNACFLDDIRIQQFRIRACENLVAVAMTNYPTIGDDEGRSVAFNSEGEYAVRAGKYEGVFLAKFNIAELRERRSDKIWGNAYRRPHRYDALLETEKDPIWNRRDGYGRPWKAEQR